MQTHLLVKQAFSPNMLPDNTPVQILMICKHKIVLPHSVNCNNQ